MKTTNHPATGAPKAVWITWEHQLRNRSMTAMLDVPLHVISHRGGRFLRYWRCARDTLALVWREQPQVVFAQNPSIVLNYFLLVLRPFFSFRFVTDAHYGGIVAHTGSKTLQKTLDLANRSADLVIVTNARHAAHVQQIGGTPVVCPDPLPDLGGHGAADMPSDKSVFYICSYDIDEPFEAVFQAAELLANDGFTVFASGNYRRAGIDPARYPHVKLLGFVPENDFYRQLFASAVVVDLTDNEDCLVCGAYEAMVAEKPLVTSSTASLREFFNKGTIFTRHDSASIAEAVRVAYRDRERLRDEICAWKVQADEMQQFRKSELMALAGLGRSSQESCHG